MTSGNRQSLIISVPENKTREKALYLSGIHDYEAKKIVELQLSSPLFPSCGGSVKVIGKHIIIYPNPLIIQTNCMFPTWFAKSRFYYSLFLFYGFDFEIYLNY